MIFGCGRRGRGGADRRALGRARLGGAMWRGGAGRVGGGRLPARRALLGEPLSALLVDRDVCVPQGRIYIRRDKSGVSRTLCHSRSTLLIGSNVDPPLSLAQVYVDRDRDGAKAAPAWLQPRQCSHLSMHYASPRLRVGEPFGGPSPPIWSLACSPTPTRKKVPDLLQVSSNLTLCAVSYAGLGKQRTL